MFKNFQPRGDVEAENLAENLRKPVVVVRFVVMRGATTRYFSPAGRNTQFKSRIMSAVHPQSNTVQGPQHISGQEIDGHLPGGRIGHRVAEHQLFIEE